MRNLILVLTVLFLTACGSETKTVEVEKIVEVPVVVEPEKPKGGIAITIDDGISLSSVLEHADLFDRYNAAGTLFVSHYGTSMNDGLLTLQDVYGWEIGHHTQAHKSATAYIDEFGVAMWLQNEITNMLKAMTASGLNVETFAYPFGHYSIESNEALKPYFKNVRGFGGTKKGDYSEAFYNDGYFYFGAAIDSPWLYREPLKMAMDEALEEGKTLVLAAHVIGDHTNEYAISLDDLEFILDYASAIGLEFKTMSEL